jgi:hypothetical protein
MAWSVVGSEVGDGVYDLHARGAKSVTTFAGIGTTPLHSVWNPGYFALQS